MRIEKGNRITFKAALPSPSTQGYVISVKDEKVFGKLDNGNYFRENKQYIQLIGTKTVTLGDLRKYTENLPDHTVLIVDNQYLCSVLHLDYMDWVKENKITGEKYNQPAVIMDNTMKNTMEGKK